MYNFTKNALYLIIQVIIVQENVIFFITKGGSEAKLGGKSHFNVDGEMKRNGLFLLAVFNLQWM